MTDWRKAMPAELGRPWCCVFYYKRLDGLTFHCRSRGGAEYFPSLSLPGSDNHLSFAGGATPRTAHPRARPLKSETTK